MNQPISLETTHQALPGRIMLLIHSLEGGGSERQMACLANDLSSHQGTHVALLTIASAHKDRYELHPSIQRMSLDREQSKGGFVRGLVQNYLRMRAIRKVVRDWRPNLLISFCDSTNTLALASCGKQLPVLISERNDPRQQIMSPVWETLRRRYYPRAVVCVAQSHEIATAMKDSFFRSSPTKVLSIPSAIDTPRDWRYSDREGAAEATRWNDVRTASTPKVLLFVGRLEAQKRVDRLLRAWARCEATHSNWRLKIVGNGSLRGELQQLTDQLGCKRVDWKEWTANIVNEYMSAHAFVLPSDYEGFPQSLVEAMTAGLAIVTTESSSAIREAIEDGVSGVIVPAGAELFDSIAPLLDSESLRRRLGLEARKRANMFQWPNVASRWYEAIQIACASRPYSPDL